jgi:hypothetical protein
MPVSRAEQSRAEQNSQQRKEVHRQSHALLHNHYERFFFVLPEVHHCSCACAVIITEAFIIIQHSAKETASFDPADTLQD